MKCSAPNAATNGTLMDTNTFKAQLLEALKTNLRLEVTTKSDLYNTEHRVCVSLKWEDDDGTIVLLDSSVDYLTTPDKS